MNTNLILEAKGLTKQFEEVAAINRMDLQIERGKVYGLIGRNGAGKTTLLKLLSQMLLPTEGELSYQPEYIKCMSDIAFGRAYNVKFFTSKIKELIEIASCSYENWRQDFADELIDRFELNVKKKYSNSSSGMQTMTSLVIALSANPELLLLDEPYVGLDPINREVFYDFLRKHYLNGEKTVIISSHMIKEIEGYFERSILIDKGNILLNEELEDIKEKSFILSADAKIGSMLEKNYNVLSKEELGNRKTYYVYDKIDSARLSELRDNNVDVSQMDLQTLMIKMLTKGGKI